MNYVLGIILGAIIGWRLQELIHEYEERKAWREFERAHRER